MDLNSRASSIDFQYLADVAIGQGGNAQLAEQIVAANTSIEAYKLSQADAIEIASTICADARSFARSVTGDGTDIEVWAIDRQGGFLGHAGFGQ